MTQAIILCGGRGTRLSALYSDRPKILVPVAGRPFIEWQLEWLAQQGITEIHLAAGYKAEALRAWLQAREQEAGGKEQEPEVRGQEGPIFSLRQSAFSFSITISTEPSPLGTGGGLKYIEPWLRSDPFLVLNGDSLVPNLQLGGLQRNHIQNGRLVTIAATRIAQAGRYGTVEFDATGRITAFREKEIREGGWVNAGAYLVAKAILGEIPARQAVSLETGLFPDLARRGLIGAMPCPPPLLDMGTPDGIAAMEAYLA